VRRVLCAVPPCAVALVALACTPAAVRPAPRSPTYVLPFATGTSADLLQGYEGPWGHEGHAAFSYDFQMPIGSVVRAARGGEVVHVVEGNADATRKPGEENVLVVAHGDGTFARYYHLTRDGVLVGVGERVAQGQEVAHSGDSGASAGPHLHFDVTRGCYEWGCETIRIEFADVIENPLRQGASYTAR
jgi:murein DD-endopeptidase MepM/ murein hydrolase activator NlpD